MADISIEGLPEDRPFFEYLAREGFKNEVSLQKPFAGTEEILRITITLTQVLVPVLIAYISSRNGRIVIIDGRKLIFKGYNLDEIAKALKDVSKK